ALLVDESAVSEPTAAPPHDRSACKPWCGHNNLARVYQAAPECMVDGTAFGDDYGSGRRWCTKECLRLRLPAIEATTEPKPTSPVMASHSYPVRCANCGHETAIKV